MPPVDDEPTLFVGPIPDGPQPEPAAQRAATREALERGRTRWKALSIETYAFIYRTSSFAGIPEPVRIAVANGTTLERSPPADTDESIENMSDLFDRAAFFLGSDIDDVRIEIDEEYGYPMRIGTDRRRRWSDDEWSFWVPCFSPDPRELSNACTVFEVTCYSPTQNFRYPPPTESEGGCACEVEGQQFCGLESSLECIDGFWRIQARKNCALSSCDGHPANARECLSAFTRCEAFLDLDQTFCGVGPLE